MRLQLIRNATLRLNYAGHELLIDPYFAAKGSRPSLRGRSPNPLVELPLTPQQIMAGVELVLVSHLHADHFDPEAQRLLPKNLPILCKPQDAGQIRAMGFEKVMPLEDSLEWQGITFTRTPGEHGSGAVRTEMRSVCGFVLQAESEPKVYWAGDTIWCPAVSQSIQRHVPQVIVTHSSGAVWGEGVLIVMDAAQTVNVCRAAPASRVIAVHLDSLDHGTVSRDDLRRVAVEAGIPASQLLIPADGESLELG